MLITLDYMARPGPARDYHLVEILRCISQYDYSAVIGRQWRVSDLEIWMYGPLGGTEDDLNAMFPEGGVVTGEGFALVGGERLMERSAVVQLFESGHFLRLVDPAVPVELESDYKLLNGPVVFQASNVDLEIRCAEACPYEIVSSDENLIAKLNEDFAGSRIRY